VYGNNLPSSWRRVTAEDIVLPVKGSIVSGPFGSNIGKKFFVEEGIPLIRGNNLTLGGKHFVDDGFVFITEEKAHELRNCEALPNDIVFTAAGTLGQVGIIPSNGKYKRYIISNKQLRLRANLEIADPLYLYYWFSSPLMRSYIINQNTGASIPLITLRTLRSLPINLPPLIIQRRIAGILSAYDDLIENNMRRIRILGQMAQAIYHERFGKVDKASLPKGWEKKEIGDIAEVKGGKRLPKGHDVLDEITDHPYLRVKDFTERGLSRNDIKYIDEETYRTVKNYTITNEDIYISIAGTIGRVGIVPADYSYSNLTENAAKICNIKPVVNKYFLLHFLQSTDGQKQIASRMVGTSQPKLALFRIKEIHFALPPQHIMNELGEKLSEFAQLVEVLDRKNANLRQTRDLLLPRLVSGEIPVHE
jgi:type I restriction enzyme S subunit